MVDAVRDLIISIFTYGKDAFDFGKPIANQPVRRITLQFKDEKLEKAYLDYESAVLLLNRTEKVTL